jgi:predicted RND superfamily exporter protein
VGKVYNLCKVKTDISAMLTVKSGLDPHMIIELEDDLKSWTMFMVIIMLLLYLFFSFNVGWYILVP